MTALAAYAYGIALPVLLSRLPEPQPIDPATRARQYRLLFAALRTGGWVLGGAWLLALLVLFGLGILLSRFTVSAIERNRFPRTSTATAGERIARALYRVIVAAASAYFFLSIPVLAMVGIALPVVVSGLLLIQTGSVLPGALPALLAAYNLVAIARSARRRIGPRQGRGWPILVEEEPDLWEFSEAVAARVGVRRVDAIWLTPGASISVAQSGSLRRGKMGQGERHLSLGLGALPGMSQGRLRSILAHEYAHFLHGDTAEGLLESTTRAMLDRPIYALISRRKAHSYNPVWLFVVGYDRAFLRVMMGASRLREVLADRLAAAVYGPAV